VFFYIGGNLIENVSSYVHLLLLSWMI